MRQEMPDPVQLRGRLVAVGRSPGHGTTPLAGPIKFHNSPILGTSYDAGVDIILGCPHDSEEDEESVSEPERARSFHPRRRGGLQDAGMSRWSFVDSLCSPVSRLHAPKGHAFQRSEGGQDTDSVQGPCRNHAPAIARGQGLRFLHRQQQNLAQLCGMSGSSIGKKILAANIMVQGRKHLSGVWKGCCQS